MQVTLRPDSNQMTPHSLRWFCFTLEAMRDMTIHLRLMNAQSGGILMTRRLDGRSLEMGQLTNDGHCTLQVKAMEKVILSAGHPYSYSTLLAFLQRNEDRLF